MPRASAARLTRAADYRAGERVRRNLPAGPRPTAGLATGFRRAPIAPTHSRRGPPVCQHVSSAPDEEAHRRKHSRRLSRREPEPEESASAKIWFRESAAESDRGTNRRNGRNRAETRAGVASLPRAALTYPFRLSILPPPAQ